MLCFLLPDSCRLGLNFNRLLEDAARYAGLLLAPAEGFGLRPRLFLPFGPFGQKNAGLAHFCNFWCPLVTLVTFSSNICNFERNPKKTKKIKIKSIFFFINFKEI